MAVAAAPIVPAFADRLAFGAPTSEADRDADAIGKGGIQRLEQGRHADRHPVQPALAIILLHVVISFQIAAGRWPRPSALPRGEQQGVRGQRESAGVVRAQRA